jgi:hypothetical protein
MDAPEVKYSVRIYKQVSLTLTTMTLFLTRHIGIESLCTAWAIIHEADKICLPTPKDAQGNSTALCDFYGRRLLDLLIEKDGICESLASSICQKKLLHTHSVHGNSVESGIHLLSVTGTTFPFPTNWPAHPETTNYTCGGQREWCGTTIKPRTRFILSAHDPMQTGIRKPLFLDSNIPNTGYGVFRKPHVTAIAKGSQKYIRWRILQQRVLSAVYDRNIVKETPVLWHRSARW